MPPMDVIMGRIFALILCGLFIGVVFADVFVNKKSYTRSILKRIGLYKGATTWDPNK